MLFMLFESMYPEYVLHEAVSLFLRLVMISSTLKLWINPNFSWVFFLSPTVIIQQHSAKL